jgi:hypothetical protein
MFMTARLVAADYLVETSVESSQKEIIYKDRTLVQSEHEVLVILIQERLKAGTG